MKNSENLLPRKILPEIIKYLDSPGIILLLGSRQVGKTSILHLLIGHLKNRGVPENNIYYFDLEDIDILEKFNSGVKEFIAYLKALGVDIETKNYIFVDEIQHMENPTNFLKLIADHHKNLKLIVSGSSTLQIRRKFKDSLAGRKIVFEVYPLDFYEFLIFKGAEKRLYEGVKKSDIRHTGIKDDIENIPVRFFADELTRYFNEYAIFGGYPAVTLEPDHDKKIMYLMDIYNSYVKKDIKDIMRVDNVLVFNNLLKALALQIGNLVNITELSSSLKVARETLERYLFLLENTFIIKLLSPFSGNPRKEISKMPKVYFIDNGLRNIVIKNMDSLYERIDTGALSENAVFSNILKNLQPLEEIHFWRTLSKNEVDFVITKGNALIPVEVKNTTFRSAKIPSGIRSFQKQYKCKNSFVLTRDFWGKSEKTIFLPLWLC